MLNKVTEFQGISKLCQSMVGRGFEKIDVKISFSADGVKDFFK